MADSSITTVNGIEIDEAKAKELLQWLIFTEKNNVKTKAKNDQQMVAAIQKKIEEVVQCY
ncbi:MAG: hypothetical protein FWD25_00495 [Clostridia bacterium]|nr:hypothetical protein [Clostridia bacterium]